MGSWSFESSAFSAKHGLFSFFLSLFTYNLMGGEFYTLKEVATALLIMFKLK